MLKKIKAAGLRFSYSRYTVVPEIPHVTDVLYAMDLGEKQECYTFCVGNHATYVENVGLVIAAVAVDVLCMERYDDAEARKIIAGAIVDLCPEEAQCLFVGHFVEAMKLIVVNTPDVDKMTREERIFVCGCAKCKRRIAEEQIRPVC